MPHPISDSDGKRGTPSVAAPRAEGPRKRPKKPRPRGKQRKKGEPGGWQTPRKTAAPQEAEPSQPTRSQNYYGVLSQLPEAKEPEPPPPTTDEAKTSPNTVSKSARRPKGARKNQPRTDNSPQDQKQQEREVEPEVEAQQVYDRPHQASYFIPGRVEGRPIQFLLDTGCTTNLLGKHVFDRLPERIREQKKEYSRHGLLADGTRLPFYGIIRLDIRLRQVKTEEVFIISQINEDAILGMPFLVEHRCAMDFHRPILKLDGQEVKCTDRQGRLLANHIQAIRGEVLPPESEKTIMCRVTSRNYCPIGLVEALPEGVPLAASLNQPNEKGQLLVRCLNPSKLPVELKSGAVVGTYTGVEEQEVEVQAPTQARECQAGPAEVPGHVSDLFEAAKRNCSSKRQEEQLASLLVKYSQVFSAGDGYVGLTKLVEHSIPVVPGTRPIRQPPHRLGPEKEAEAERQVQELLEKRAHRTSWRSMELACCPRPEEGSELALLCRL